MKNNLFNKSQMIKNANKKAFQLTIPKHDFLKNHTEKIKNGDFKSEKSSYLYFYDFLKEILGYDREKNILFEDKEAIGRGKVEFVLKTATEQKFMVIELKDQDKELDKPQTRANDKRSPVDQAFSYAQHSDPNNPIDWIMVSNFKEFRLYNYTERSGKCLCFTYKDLLDKEKFKSFMVAFSKESHISKGYPDKILKETLVVEKKLEHNFYKLFHETRLMLIKELEEINDLSREQSVHYAQLILNRYMFIAFAEDSGLLKSQISTDTIATPIKKGNLRHRSIWQRLNELFLDINEGNEYKKISAYNGGLFEEDLDFIKIRDTVEDQQIFKDVWQNWNFNEYEKDIKPILGSHADVVNPIYKNLLTISSFDFSSELDVNILGHIFENSIGDLEELKTDTKGRRKKDGIFYTPEYITDYICRNTIIPYLSKTGKAESVEELIHEYSDGDEIDVLESKVMNIRIVDPACGSGAFLNKAADVLLNIHKAIYNFKKAKYTSIIETRGGKGKDKVKREAKHVKLDSFFDEVNTRREILIHNIYGVDLNEESTDITKLSLFLKVCQKDRKLPELDNNIKCGNSLIDDPKYTDKPFKWHNEFPEIFREGGFDIVIGNPPYVRQEKIKEIKPYLKEHYEVYTGVADLYVYFFESGLNILKNGGELSYISSNKFIKAHYGKKLRKFILNQTVFQRYVDHTWDKIFEGATVHSSIFIFKKDSKNEDNNIFVNNDFFLEQSRLNINSWGFEHPKLLNIKEKIVHNGIEIKKIETINIYWGIKPGFDKAFVIDAQTKNELLKSDPENINIIKPLVRGRDIKKWAVDFNNLFLLYIPWKFPIEDYPSIKQHLLKFESGLKKRAEVKTGRVNWFTLSRYASDYVEEFEEEKLIYPEIAPKLYVAYDDKKLFANNKCFIITSKDLNLKFIAALLSSKTLNFVFKFMGSTLEGKRFNLSKIYVEQLPIYQATAEEQEPLIEKADLMIGLNNQFQGEVKGFQNWLKQTFKVEKLSQKLEKYYELDLDNFLDELRKKKVDVRSRDNQELLKKEYQKSLDFITPLLQVIELTDKQIDSLVYELYGLTEDEIKIIESNLG